jgi:hypothetical protein
MTDFRTKHGLIVANSLIFASGNVGINNATPDAMLTVGGTANIEGNAVFTGSSVIIGNSTVNSIVNSTSFSTGIANVVSTATVGANVNITTSGFTIGSNTIVNSSIINVFNSFIGTAVKVGANAFLNTSALFLGNSTVNTVIKSDSANIILLTSSNVSVNSSTLFVDTGLKGVGVNTAPFNNLVVSGAGNVQGDFRIGGDLQIIGNITTTGSQTLARDLPAFSNAGFNLGNTTNRWSGWFGPMDVGINSTFSDASTLSNTATMPFLTVGNSTVNSTFDQATANGGTINLTAFNIGANVAISTSQMVDWQHHGQFCDQLFGDCGRS